MALLDRKLVITEFGALGSPLDVCVFCEDRIRRSAREKKVSVDEMHKEIRQLNGKLSGVKVGKVYVGGSMACICPDCVKAMNNYVNPVQESDLSSIIGDISEDVHEELPKVNTPKIGGKGKSKGDKDAE